MISGGGILQRSIITRLLLFEIGLLISTKLSYAESFVAYIVAYNVGILLFLTAFYVKPNVNSFNELSKLGFAFFLGAKFPIGIVKLYIDFSQSLLMQITGWFIEFIMAVLFSWVITRYIEKPLFAWGKAIEVKLGKF